MVEKIRSVVVEDVEKQSIVYLTGSQGDQRVFKMVLFLNDTLALFCLDWAGGLSEEDKRRTEMCNKGISPLLNSQGNLTSSSSNSTIICTAARKEAILSLEGKRDVIF